MEKEDLIRNRRKAVLKKMAQATEECLKSVAGGDWNALGKMFSERENCLKILSLSEKETGGVRIELDASEEALLQELGFFETRLVNLIESEKEQILKETQSIRKAKDTIAKFKSSWVNESGEEIDEKL